MSKSNSSKVIKGVSYQTLVTIGLGVLEVVVFSIMSRLLSQEDFGYYAAITAVTSIFTGLSDAGIGSALIQQKNIDRKYINNAFTISLIFGVILAVILCFTAGFLSELIVDSKLRIPLMLMSITLVCNSLASVNLSILQRRLQFLTMGVVNLIVLIISSSVAIYLAYKGFGFYAIVARAILTAFFLMVVSWLFARTRYAFDFDYEIFKSIFRFSGWLTASGIVRDLALQVDRLLMARLLSVQSLGAYNRPKEFITQISGKINGIFDTVLFPVLSGIQDEKKKLGAAFTKSLYYMNILSALLALSFILNSSLIIRVFFGADWLNLRLVFCLLSIALIFNIDARLSDCYLRSMGLTKEQFFFRLLQLGLQVVGVFIGANWDIIGVAISVVVANVIVVFAKLTYIAIKIDVSKKEAIKSVLETWKVSLFLLPLALCVLPFIPNTLTGNIMYAVYYVLALVIPVCVFPALFGRRFKAEVYDVLLRKLKQKNKLL